MAEEKEAFLARWSRLKREAPAAEEKPENKEASPAPALPSLDKLGPNSDFTAFMHPRVKQELRRLALKKLFSDPHFNVPDPFEPYSRDWNNFEPLTPDLVAQLEHAKSVLFTPEEKQEPKPGEKPEAKPAAKPRDDEPGRENT